MRFALGNLRYAVVLGSALAMAAFACAAPAKADIVTGSPSLPLLGVAYESPTGAGCFDIASVCVTPGRFVQTSLVSPNTFSMGNELIDANATFDATLTAIGGSTPIGSVALAGTVQETVFGRTSDAETGTFTVEMTGLSLSGTLMLPGSPLNGITLMAGPGSSTTTGMTSITPIGGGEFRISSFFDVFVDISLPSGLSRDVGPILVVAVPEPSTWALMLAGLASLGLAAGRRSRQATVISTAT